MQFDASHHALCGNILRDTSGLFLFGGCIAASHPTTFPEVAPSQVMSRNFWKAAPTFCSIRQLGMEQDCHVFTSPREGLARNNQHMLNMKTRIAGVHPCAECLYHTNTHRYLDIFTCRMLIRIQSNVLTTNLRMSIFVIDVRDPGLLHQIVHLMEKLSTNENVKHRIYSESLKSTHMHRYLNICPPKFGIRRVLEVVMKRTDCFATVCEVVPS